MINSISISLDENGGYLINEVPAAEFYKDKPINYPDYVHIKPLHKYIDWVESRNIPSGCKEIAMIGTRNFHDWNPNFDPSGYLRSLGYVVTPNPTILTGCYIYFLNKNE